MSMKNTRQARHEDCIRMGDFFMILAHSTRMRIFCALQNGPKNVTGIAEEAEISISNASQHLRLMRDRGALISERRRQTVYYGVADPRFFQAASLIRKALDDRSKTCECDRFSAGAKGLDAIDPMIQEVQLNAAFSPPSTRRRAL